MSVFEGAATIIVLIAGQTRTYLLAPADCPPARARDLVARAIAGIPGRTGDEKRRALLTTALQDAAFRACGAVTSRIKQDAARAWRATGPSDPEEAPGIFVVRSPGVTLYFAAPLGVAWRKVLAAFRSAMAQHVELVSQATPSGLACGNAMAALLAQVRLLYTSAGFREIAAIQVSLAPLQIIGLPTLKAVDEHADRC